MIMKLKVKLDDNCFLQTVVTFNSELYDAQINVDFSTQDESMCFPALIAYQKVNDTQTFSGNYLLHKFICTGIS